MKTIGKIILSICLIGIGLAPLAQAEVGVTGSEILIGSSLPETGHMTHLGQQTKTGLMAYINKINNEGGVNGRNIKVIFYDDKYEPIPCVRNTQKLINQDKVFALTCYVGTASILKAQPVWTRAKVPIVGLFSGAIELRKPFKHYTINIRPSFNAEEKIVVDGLVNQLGIKKIAIFYEFDAFGNSVKKAAEEALRSHGLTPVAFGSFPRGTVDIAAGLEKIKAANPGAVIMGGTADALSKFVIEAKKAGMTRTYFQTPSTTGSEMFVEELDASNATDRVIITHAVPPHCTSNLAVVDEYIIDMGKSFPNDDPSCCGFEAYANAHVLVEGIKRAGKNLTRERLISAIETIKPGELGSGLNFEYGPNDHEGISGVYLTRIKKGASFEFNNWDIVK